MPIRYTKDGEPYLDPSRMTAQITFLDPVAGTDASGATVSYAPGSPPDTAWAEIVPVRGADALKAGQDVSMVYITATINYRASNPRTAQMRFWDSRMNQYVIKAVEDVVPGMLKFQVLTSLLVGQDAD